jgi:hypothetical protein
MAVFSASTALFGVAKAGTPIISKLLDHWQTIVIAVLLSIVFYQNTFDTRVFFWADTIPYLRNLTEEQRDQIDFVANANEMLSNVIERNNERVEEFRVLSVEADQKRIAAEAENEVLRNRTMTQVTKILQAPTPQSCEAAIDFLRNSIPTLQYDIFNNQEGQ